MNDDADTTAVLDALRGSVGPVSMGTPVEDVLAAGRRHRRGRRTAVATGAAAVAGIAAVAATQLTAPPAAGVHVHTAAYSVDSATDGTVRVTWTKERYFSDHAGLEAALRQAGIPVLIKVGEFCRGPQDDPQVGPSGSGPGVEDVVHGEGGRSRPEGSKPDAPGADAKPDGTGPAQDKPDQNEADQKRADQKRADQKRADQKDTGGKEPGAAPDAQDPGYQTEPVVLVFTPSAVPPGKQLFIGYLDAEQLAITGGRPGSIERLVPIDGPLVCTTDFS
jgi:hypothetical protein